MRRSEAMREESCRRSGQENVSIRQRRLARTCPSFHDVATIWTQRRFARWRRLRITRLDACPSGRCDVADDLRRAAVSEPPRGGATGSHAIGRRGQIPPAARTCLFTELQDVSAAHEVACRRATRLLAGGKCFALPGCARYGQRSGATQRGRTVSRTAQTCLSSSLLSDISSGLA